MCGDRMSKLQVAKLAVQGGKTSRNKKFGNKKSKTCGEIGAYGVVKEETVLYFTELRAGRNQARSSLD